MGSLALFFFFITSLSYTCQLRNLADMTAAQADGDISAETRHFIHVHTRRKRIYLQDVLGTSDSSLRDHCGVPGSRKSITIRWRRSRSLSRRSCSARIHFETNKSIVSQKQTRVHRVIFFTASGYEINSVKSYHKTYYRYHSHYLT